MGEFFAYLELREWQSAEIVMKSGESGDFMGFLVEGKLAVKMEAIFHGKFILVAVLERGSLVGETSVVEEGYRHATVVATEQSRVLILSRENMERMLGEAPALGLKLLRRIIHVLGHRLGKASDRLSKLL
ncbi:cyclic nucleotide-binding domain-containing protein [Thiovibrio frasassiensis]|uniref:Cyclic nucleotide-binding domain-containing protein n=1 Tax=Thiovibrio frasassiensis TaxID=2984131 RepID=A0A9X4RMI0_9BACT|nr:cyclic nucleotide-binding domain-containing protein [Thiovibrio frasassiensis]MDG4476390.1 cyclic nucleotide-binding domain-containing protein [Thiovibrio frasassiensis]